MPSELQALFYLLEGSGLMLFFHLSDVHLGAVPDRGKPWSDQRAKGIYESFYQVLYQAKADGADLVFICGDLFHRQPLKRELKELAYHFAQAAPVHFFIIGGNHDPVTGTSSYKSFSWPENVTFFGGNRCQRAYIPSLNLCVYGFSYDRQEITQPLYDSLSPEKTAPNGEMLPGDCRHILLAHGGDQKHIPIRWDRLRSSGFDYIALGHIHKPWIDATGTMAYCGALEPVDKNDEGPHGFIRGQIKNGQVSVQFVPAAKWNYVNLSVSVQGDMTWGQICDRVSEGMERCGKALKDGEENLYKITLEGFKNVDLETDLQEISAMDHVVSVADATVWDFDFDSLYEANKGNLLGRYMDKVRAMDVDDKTRNKILYYGFWALYRTGDSI